MSDEQVQTFTKLRDPRFPKMGSHSIKMMRRTDGVWIYPISAYPELAQEEERIVPVCVLKEWDIPFGRSHVEAYESQMRRSIERYKEARRNMTPEQKAEEAFERRAAFGPGVRVVDVFSGDEYIT